MIFLVGMVDEQAVDNDNTFFMSVVKADDALKPPVSEEKSVPQISHFQSTSSYIKVSKDKLEKPSPREISSLIDMETNPGHAGTGSENLISGTNTPTEDEDDTSSANCIIGVGRCLRISTSLNQLRQFFPSQVVI